MHYKKFMDVILEHVTENGGNASFKDSTVTRSEAFDNLINSLLVIVNRSNQRITYQNLALASDCAKRFPGQYSRLLAQYCYQLSNN